MRILNPYINYGILFWGNSTYSEDIFKIQKKALRNLAGLKARETCRQKFSEIGIFTAANLYIYKCLLYMHENKSKYHTNTENDKQPHLLRHKNVRQLQCSNNTIYKSFVNTAIKLYNTLNNSLKTETNINRFKKIVKTHYLGNEYYNLGEYLEICGNQNIK